MAKGKARETLISFESGHYKKVTGQWVGDSVWMHIKKDSGGMVHINKDKVEYAETFKERAEKDSLAPEIIQRNDTSPYNPDN